MKQNIKVFTKKEVRDIKAYSDRANRSLLFNEEPDEFNIFVELAQLIGIGVVVLSVFMIAVCAVRQWG